MKEQEDSAQERFVTSRVACVAASDGVQIQRQAAQNLLTVVIVWYERLQIRPVHGKRTRLTPKSKRSKRDIPIDDELAALLREHRTRWREEKLRLSRENCEWQTTDLVFPSEVGTPMMHDNLRRHFYAALEKAKLSRIRFHDLQHTAGSLMLRQDISIVAVSEILGHSSVAVTAQVYAHSFADQRRELGYIFGYTDACLKPLTLESAFRFDRTRLTISIRPRATKWHRHA